MVYLKAPWWARRLDMIVMTRLPRQPVIRVRGRVTGRPRTVPVRPITVGASRYLVGLRGNTHWARNLRASGAAELVEGGATTTIAATEVVGEERSAAVASYLATSTFRPTIRLLTEDLPDPADHPVFRIE